MDRMRSRLVRARPVFHEGNYRPKPDITAAAALSGSTESVKGESA
jgi:hypothetical protein